MCSTHSSTPCPPYETLTSKDIVTWLLLLSGFPWGWRGGGTCRRRECGETEKKGPNTCCPLPGSLGSGCCAHAQLPMGWAGGRSPLLSPSGLGMVATSLGVLVFPAAPLPLRTPLFVVPSLDSPAPVFSVLPIS